MPRPLNTLFLITSMPVGGAEVLLGSLVRNFDRSKVVPQIACLKDLGQLGEELSREIPVHSHLIKYKLDAMVLWRLRKLFRAQQIDAVVTVGAGDKMFWGRLAARLAGVPVILSALHSTGWPDGVGRLNRMLTPLTDGFIGVARSHGEFLVNHERFPASKVYVIRNGIDTDRFRFDPNGREKWRERLGIGSGGPLVGIVAALRPEKNHRLFLEAAQRTLQTIPEARFAIAGDGGIRTELEAYAEKLGVSQQVIFVGNVSDTPGFLSAIDLFALTSDNEASPVSIVEAMSCRRPVVATNVGSVAELVAHEQSGYLTPVGSSQAISDRWVTLLRNASLRETMGKQGREFVSRSASLREMVNGYTSLIEKLFATKTGQFATAAEHSFAETNNRYSAVRGSSR